MIQDESGGIRPHPMIARSDTLIDGLSSSGRRHANDQPTESPATITRSGRPRTVAASIWAPGSMTTAAAASNGPGITFVGVDVDEVAMVGPVTAGSVTVVGAASAASTASLSLTVR